MLTTKDRLTVFEQGLKQQFPWICSSLGCVNLVYPGSQALIKWLSAMYVLCDKCHHVHSYYRQTQTVVLETEDSIGWMTEDIELECQLCGCVHCGLKRNELIYFLKTGEFYCTTCRS